jgi:nucleoside-diphosphate-sugar epimerase
VALRKKDEAAARAVNVGGTATVLDEAAAAGLDPVVHVSSLVALFPPTGPTIRADDPPTHPVQPYSASKADAHRSAVAAQERGQPVTILTLGGVWGPGTGAAALTEQLAAAVALLKVGVPVSKTGGMPVLDVRDAAKAVTACLEPGKGPRRFILGGHFVPTGELADRISESTGRRLRRYRVPARLVIASGTACDVLMKVLPVTLPVTREGMAFLTGNVPADNQPTVEALGLTLRPAQDTLDDTYEWLVRSGHVSASRAPRWASENRRSGAASDKDGPS